MTSICLICVFLWSTIQTLQASSISSDYYVGAVVEYHPLHLKNDFLTTMSQNAECYKKFMKTASENAVDIIVFPEYGLIGSPSRMPGLRGKLLSVSGSIPDPKDNKIPCGDISSSFSEVLKTISCAAKMYAMYVVINLHEKEICTGVKCRADGYTLYNTNVAFDRNGAVVGRYRKWNLFNEDFCDRPSESELSYFQTDFGVIFGQFICFDILFDMPALKLVREKHITDIVYPAHWFSELPYQTSNVAQAAYSYNNDINFLGSGFNSPLTGSGGSGIYAGKNGVIGRVWPEKRTNVIIIAKVPKIIDGKRRYTMNPAQTQIIGYNAKDIPTIVGGEPVPRMRLNKENMAQYATELYNPEKGNHESTVCYGEFCCRFAIRSEYRKDLVRNCAKYYRYRLAVFRGTRPTGVNIAGFEVCSIIACIDDTLENCGERFDTNSRVVYPITFNSIDMNGIYEFSRSINRYPVSLNTLMDPLNVDEFIFVTDKINDTRVNVKLSLIKPQNDLMTFAIYGRNFEADRQNNVRIVNPSKSRFSTP